MDASRGSARQELEIGEVSLLTSAATGGAAESGARRTADPLAHARSHMRGPPTSGGPTKSIPERAPGRTGGRGCRCGLLAGGGRGGRGGAAEDLGFSLLDNMVKKRAFSG